MTVLFVLSVTLNCMLNEVLFLVNYNLVFACKPPANCIFPYSGSQLIFAPKNHFKAGKARQLHDLITRLNERGLSL